MGWRTERFHGSGSAPSAAFVGRAVPDQPGDYRYRRGVKDRPAGTLSGSAGCARRSGWADMHRVFLGLIAFVLGLASAGALVVAVITHRAKGAYFESKGVRLHYTVEGQGEPVVLLHGFAVHGDLNWRLPGITKALANDFRVITLDLRGHGLSDKPHNSEQYGLEMVNDVPRLLDHLQIDKVHVIGYSLGGFITLKLAAAHPERLITASVLGAGWEHPGNSTFLNTLPQLESALRSGKGIGPLMAHLGAERRKPGLLHTWAVRIMTGYLNDVVALAAMVSEIPALTLTEKEVRSIRIPTCTIVGSRDPLRVSAEAMARLVPADTLVIVEGARHVGMPMRREMLMALKRFLRQHPAVL
jgi:pimeloyl-ACP methyl ester carboxylesterase